MNLVRPEMSEEVAHLSGKDEGLHISENPELFLKVAQKVSEVNVEKSSRVFLKHVISRVPISDAEHISCRTLACRALDEVLVELAPANVLKVF